MLLLTRGSPRYIRNLILDEFQGSEDEPQKIVSKPVDDIGGITFIPYTGMAVFAYIGDTEEKAKRVHVFKKIQN
jgi:hypothetical protein